MTANSMVVATILLLSVAACRPSSTVAPTTVTPMPGIPILLLTVDALRADHLSIYGYPRDTAPALSRLAEDAVVFERAFTPCPRTSPAFASLFTGKYPHGHGLRQLGQELAGDNLTLAELLAEAGYSSRGFVSSTVLVGQLSGLDQGFDAWDDLLPARERNRENYQRIAAETVASVSRELDGGWQPGFLFLHLIDPHGPYAAPEPRSFAPGPAASASGLFEPSLVPEYQRLDQRPRLRDYIDAYDAEISYADAWLGRLLERLRQTDLYDRALIVVTADHGEAFGEHGSWFRHGATLHEESTRVPLLIKLPAGPRAAAPARVTAAVSLVDLLPTLLDYAGVSPPPGLHGSSLRGLLEGDSQSSRAVFSTRTGRTIKWAAHTRQGTLLASDCPGGDPGLCAWSWFDAADADSRDGLPAASAPAGTAEKLRDFVTRSRAATLSFAVARRYRPSDRDFVGSFMQEHNRGEAGLDRQQRLALEELGYLQPLADDEPPAGRKPSEQDHRR